MGLEIDSEEFMLRRQSDQQIHIIDVREPVEYHTYNLGGLNIPLGKLPEQIENLDFDLSDEIVVLCQRGIRSKTAQQLLEAAGFRNIRNLKGGILGIEKSHR